MSAKQAVTLAVLLSGAGAVWAPQVKERFFAGSTSQSVPVGVADVPAILVAEFPGADPVPGLASMPGPAERTPARPAEASEPGGRPADEAPVQGASGGADASQPGRSVDAALLATLEGLRNFRPEGGLNALSTPNAGGSRVASSVSTFVIDNPLTVTLMAESGSIAVMGGRVMSAGDEVQPGIVLDEVAATGVWLVVDGERHWVPMPPLRPRPGASTSARTSGSHSGSADVPGASEGASTSTPDQ